jgi:hypothetical protein
LFEPFSGEADGGLGGIEEEGAFAGDATIAQLLNGVSIEAILAADAIEVASVDGTVDLTALGTAMLAFGWHGQMSRCWYIPRIRSIAVRLRTVLEKKLYFLGSLADRSW